MTEEKFDDMILCTMCSKWSPKKDWKDEKCPACGQILILASEAITCPLCDYLVRKKDIIDGKCPKCRK